MQKALFLDRDGVINKKGKSYYIHRPEDFIFNPGLFEVLKSFTDRGYIIIVITNQGGISRGIYTDEDTVKLHEYMAERLADEGIIVTAVYYCPHHPDNEQCLCRKPGNQLFEQAIAEHNIDRSLSLMIGDSEADIEAAHKSSVRAVKVETNGNLKDIPGILDL
jgi:D-glycero-D-manno-heptose 1,7-bisphosphate phosphatase